MVGDIPIKTFVQNKNYLPKNRSPEIKPLYTN